MVEEEVCLARELWVSAGLIALRAARLIPPPNVTLTCVFYTSYIFPITVRRRLAELFQDETVVRWWLPDDHGFTPMLQSVRAFADERNAAATSARTEGLQDMKNVFAALHLGGDTSPVAGAGGRMLSPGEAGKDRSIKTRMG